MTGRLPLALATLTSGIVMTACRTPPYEARRPAEPPRHLSARVLRPVVAVTEFENQSCFAGQWKLGGGMADLLITELLNSRRVIVLERQHLDDTLGELLRQGKALFRPEGRASSGRLKNVRYLIRGAITDFTVTGDASGWFRTETTGGRLGGRSARVSLNLRITDVETGEVIASVRADGSARAGFFAATVDYRRLAFGGDAFFQTPLGRATEAAIRDAVARILDQLPTEYWMPRVADLVDGRVVINGGENVGLTPGLEMIAREAPRVVTDPLTGDPLDAFPGRVIGRLRVDEVRPTTSLASPLEGGPFPRGAWLEVVPAAPPARSRRCPAPPPPALRRRAPQGIAARATSRISFAAFLHDP
ncbi:MAG: CsgG/HfaB family protein [Kiritimatiellae bacterium]|nr:CsgG/HfaB family protein [Kiritimatiellia bacterium]